MENDWTIENLIEEWIYCYPTRNLSQSKINFLKKQHNNHVNFDNNRSFNKIVIAPSWVCRELEIEEGSNWFFALAISLDLMYLRKAGKHTSFHIDQFQNKFTKDSFS